MLIIILILLDLGINFLTPSIPYSKKSIGNKELLTNRISF